MVWAGEAGKLITQPPDWKRKALRSAEFVGVGIITIGRIFILRWSCHGRKIGRDTG